eukprot:g1789.t1
MVPLAHSRPQGERAWSLFQELRSRKLRPDVAMYSAVASACDQVHRWTFALQMLSLAREEDRAEGMSRRPTTPMNSTLKEVKPKWRVKPPEKDRVQIAQSGAPQYKETRNDSHRNQFYWDALGRCVKDKCVVDIGSGSGLLALMALKLGARKVIAIEASQDMVDLARLNAERNGAERLQNLDLRCHPRSQGGKAPGFP